MSITECGKIMVKCDVSTAQYDNRTIKCEEKNKGTIECDKSTVTYDVGNTQCEDDTIKCEKKKKGTTKCDKITVICDVSTTVLKTGPDRPVRPVQPGTGSQYGLVKTPKTGQ